MNNDAFNSLKKWSEQALEEKRVNDSKKRILELSNQLFEQQKDFKVNITPPKGVRLRPLLPKNDANSSSCVLKDNRFNIEREFPREPNDPKDNVIQRILAILKKDKEFKKEQEAFDAKVQSFILNEVNCCCFLIETITDDLTFKDVLKSYMDTVSLKLSQNWPFFTEECFKEENQGRLDKEEIIPMYVERFSSLFQRRCLEFRRNYTSTKEFEKYTQRVFAVIEKSNVNPEVKIKLKQKFRISIINFNTEFEVLNTNFFYQQFFNSICQEYHLI